jgi:DNA-binding XRE family transcriptional regulator
MLTRTCSRLVNPTQEALEAFCTKKTNQQRIRYLLVAGNKQGVKVDDFAPLAKLSKLRELYIEDAITQEQLGQIATLSHVTQLHIEHGGKITSLEPLANMTQLKGLTITTPTGWIAKLLPLPTLKPLAHIGGLEYLNLAGVAIQSDGLQPLQNLRKLRKLIVISQYDKQAKDLGNSR